MKPNTLFKILRKRIEARDKMLLLAKTRDNSFSRAQLGTYYIHDLRSNEILRSHVNLLELAAEIGIECIDTLEETCYA